MRPFSPRRVVVMGQGYVGLPLAMRAVEVGYRVTGFEPDVERLRMLRHGESYVEDVPSAQLEAALGSGRYCVSDEEAALGGFDVAVIAVPTPLTDRVPDLSAVEIAAHGLSRHLRRGAAVVLESTTYPGTTEEVVGPILKAGSGLEPGRDFSLGFSSERIDPGNPTWGLVDTPKLVSGVDESSLAVLSSFYAELVDEVVPVSSTRVAELAKLIENTFRHVNIALVNELAMLGHELGIDVGEAIGAAATKPFGFMRFDPGPGVGGHCLPVDPTYLSWHVRRRLGRSFRFVDLANEVNDRMPKFVVQRVIEVLNSRGRSVGRSRILLLGLAYKPNSGDHRSSPAIEIAGQLAALGAEVLAADPHVAADLVVADITRVEATSDVIASCDLVVLLTDHGEFDLEELARSGVTVLDTRAKVPGGDVERLYSPPQDSRVKATALTTRPRPSLPARRRSAVGRRCVVTGTAGFIGSRLSHRLLDDGWDVVGIDAFTDSYDPSEKQARAADLQTRSGFSLVRGHLDRLALDPILARAGVVFHLAGRAGVRASFELLDKYHEDNVTSTERLVAACQATASVRRLVYASSSSVYGEGERPFREDGQTLPVSPYGRSKLEAERLCLGARSATLTPIALRYFTVYGPGQRPDMGLRIFAEAALSGRPIRVFGDGTQSRDFTFVDDIVEATIRAADATSDGLAINVGGGSTVTLREVLDLLTEIVGRPLDVGYEPFARGDVRHTEADLTRAGTLLSFVASTSFDDGLRAEVSWVTQMLARRAEKGRRPA